MVTSIERSPLSTQRCAEIACPTNLQSHPSLRPVVFSRVSILPSGCALPGGVATLLMVSAALLGSTPSTAPARRGFSSFTRVAAVFLDLFVQFL